jgi:Glycosyl transferase family 2/Type I phosphodiesterase / nucleotide pyrophosphatase
MSRQLAAGPFEIWAARAWNAFNEGRPFSVVYPALVLACAAPLGLGPDGPLPLALAGALALALVQARFEFPLRFRALLWLALLVSVPLLEPWRAPGLLAGALAGYLVFTVLVWGSVYYHLRTGAPWTNGLRFWRLVLTNSDPTSGNALEQVPKLLIALAAGTLLAEEPSVGSAARILVVGLLVVVLGAAAWRRFARRLPRYPARAPTVSHSPSQRARRVYVIVVDGCNRARLRQADTPVIDRLAAAGTEYLAVEPAYPARTVVCFSSMLTGAAPAEHGMRSNFAPRLGVRVESIFDVLARRGRRGRLVGIAHLLDPFGEEVVRSVTSVQPTSAIDRSLCAEARRVVDEEDPDLLVLQLLAADQLGHVRGVRSPEYLDQLAETDRHVGDFLAFLRDRGKIGDATVILMADHGQGRGIGGHGHLDWGERPVPFVVWGSGAMPGAVAREPRSVCELAATVAELLGVDAPAAARGRPLLPALDPSVEPARPRAAGTRQRCLAIVVARDEEGAVGAVLAGIPAKACGIPVDRLLVDDGSRDATPSIGRVHGARVISHESSRGLGAALRAGLELARDEGYGAAVYLDGDGEYTPADFESLLEPIANGRADYVLGSRFLGRRDGMSWHRTLANRATSALLGTLMETVIGDGQTGYRALSGRALDAARIRHDYNYAQVLTLSLWGAGIEPVEVPIRYRRRTSGRSFVRYPEYFARVAPAIWREWSASRRRRRAIATAMPAASQYAQPPSGSNSGNSSTIGPNGASGRSVTSSPPARTST